MTMGWKVDVQKLSGSKTLFKAQKEIEVDLHETGVGTVVIITIGLNEVWNLKSVAASHKGKIEAFCGAGLVATENANHKPIQFQKNISKEDINVYLWDLFPKLSEHLDDTTTYSWVILEKFYTVLARVWQRWGPNMAEDDMPVEMSKDNDEQELYIKTSDGEDKPLDIDELKLSNTAIIFGKKEMSMPSLDNNEMDDDLKNLYFVTNTKNIKKLASTDLTIPDEWLTLVDTYAIQMLDDT
ncbi:hypothetical protein HD554DRAFT_2035094 [Boletus coccyginus]|nr:hypothetical protein HD554DRAFT_2035094 [Boletus coccyginus]